MKGRYGWDYAASPQRLTTPLIRRDDGLPEGPAVSGATCAATGTATVAASPAAWSTTTRSCRTSGRPPGRRRSTSSRAGCGEIHAAGGPGAIAGFGSAKCSNEEAYLFQKLIRTGFGTNNVDHCTRLCHASSVAALFEGVGSGAVSTTYGDIDQRRRRDHHRHATRPPTTRWRRRSSSRPAAAAPRSSTSTRGPPRSPTTPTSSASSSPAPTWRSTTAIMHEIIRLGPGRPRVHREPHVATTTSWPSTVADYPPERAAQITGIDADTIREVARIWGEAGAGVIYWGMGISQHTTGTDNARCLIALCSITGNVGRPGTGLHPLRGQNNVQGASDAGLIPMFYPDYQRRRRRGRARAVRAGVGPRARPEARADRHRDRRLGAQRAACAGCTCWARTRSCPTRTSTRSARRCAALDFLVVQDIFLTETAEFADVILPATSYLEKDGTYTNTDRRVQLGRKVLDPPGAGPARTGRSSRTSPTGSGCDWTTRTPSEVFDEMVSLMPNYAEPAATTTSADRQAVPERGPRAQRRHGRAVRRAVQHRRRAGPPGAGASGCRPRSCPTRSTRSCSTPAGCWSTGTPAR